MFQYNERRKRRPYAPARCGSDSSLGDKPVIITEPLRQQIHQMEYKLLYSVRNQYKPVGQTSEDYWECIGLLRSQWLSQKTKEVVKSICYGSAFAVSSRIIITCAHNLYNDDDGTTADRCLFIPNHIGMVQENTLAYRSAEGVFCRFIPLKKDEELSARPTPNQICLLVTEEDIVVAKRYITVGLCDIQQNEQIEAIGYPSRQFSAKPSLLEVSMKRRAERGQVSSIRGSIECGQFKTISYNLKTKKGMSGSPLLYNYKGKIVCVGIHTHGMEKGVKSGVFFNEFAIGTIKRFQQQLTEQYHLTSRIQYKITPEQPPKFHQNWESFLIQSPDTDQISHISLDDEFQYFYSILQEQTSPPIPQTPPQIQIQLNKDDLIYYCDTIGLPHSRPSLSQ